MTPEMIRCLIIFALMILGYIFYQPLKIPMGVTALIAMLLTVFVGLVTPKAALANFANKNVILILGMFVVVAGFNRTQAVKKLSRLVTKVSGGSFIKMFVGYALIGCLLSQFIPSPMSVYAVMFPLIMASCEDMGVSPSKAMFPLALVIIVIYACTLGVKLAPSTPPVAISMAGPPGKKGGKDQEALDPVRETLGYGIFLVTVLGLIFEKQTGIEGWMVTLSGVALVVATGVLTPKQATDSFPIRIVLMVIGALTMGGAMVECGLGDKIGELVAGLVGNTNNGYVIGALFFIVPFLMTQFMNNQSCAAIFQPIVILSCQALNCDPRGPLILLSAATLTAFMTPMATGTIPLVMGTGGYDQASLLKQGWLPSLIITVVSVISVMTLFPAY